MNKPEMRHALRSFEQCKKKLARNESEIGKKTQFICFAIGDSPASFYAKGIVMRSIAPWGAYSTWLAGKGYHLTRTQVQRERHRFVNVCIAELKRRLKA